MGKRDKRRKRKKRIKRMEISTPIGGLPKDPELRRKIQQLPKNHTLSDVSRIISIHEKEALKEFESMKKTKKSGRLDPQNHLSLR